TDMPPNRLMAPVAVPGGVHALGPRRGEELPLPGLAHQVLDPVGKMLAVVQQEHATGAALRDESDERGVRLGGSGGLAGDDQVVRPVIGRLTLAGIDMVQRGTVLGNLDSTVGADGAILVNQPAAMGIHRAATETAVLGGRTRGRATTICSRHNDILQRQGAAKYRGSSAVNRRSKTRCESRA